jgi:hypothetical protein
VVKHAQYESMERPSPMTASPNMLYIDMRSTELSTPEVLEAAFLTVGNAVVGYELFAAQRAIGLVFADVEQRAKFISTSLKDLDLALYAAPPEKVTLQRYTLSEVPILDTQTITDTLAQEFQPFGELVFLAPMVMEKTGWHTGMWHATLKIPQANVAEYRHPSPTAALFGTTIVVDIPNVRRFCKHCRDVEHVKATCRQGQRLRARKIDPRPSTQQPRPQPHNRPAPAAHTTADAMDDVAHTSTTDRTTGSPQTMEYEPSYMAYARAHGSTDAWQPGEIPTMEQLQAFLQQYCAAARSTSTTTHSTASGQGGHVSQW